MCDQWFHGAQWHRACGSSESCGDGTTRADVDQDQTTSEYMSILRTYFLFVIYMYYIHTMHAYMKRGSLHTYHICITSVRTDTSVRYQYGDTNAHLHRSPRNKMHEYAIYGKMKMPCEKRCWIQTRGPFARTVVQLYACGWIEGGKMRLKFFACLFWRLGA